MQSSRASHGMDRTWPGEGGALALEPQLTSLGPTRTCGALRSRSASMPSIPTILRQLPVDPPPQSSSSITLVLSHSCSQHTLITSILLSLPPQLAMLTFLQSWKYLFFLRSAEPAQPVPAGLHRYWLETAHGPSRFWLPSLRRLRTPLRRLSCSAMVGWAGRGCGLSTCSTSRRRV